MSDDGTRETEGAPPDPDTPSVARMYDFFLGGEDNFAVDRRAAEEVSRALPGVADVARSNREFLRRAVRFAAERGVDQFLDLGAGLPTQGNVHEIARSVHPGARVIYVDHDPVVTSHARALLTGYGNADVVDADLRDPGAVLSDPRVRAFIDTAQPGGRRRLPLGERPLRGQNPGAGDRVPGRPGDRRPRSRTAPRMAPGRWRIRHGRRLDRRGSQRPLSPSAT
jgi:hypothetical protein